MGESPPALSPERGSRAQGETSRLGLECTSIARDEQRASWVVNSPPEVWLPGGEETEHEGPMSPPRLPPPAAPPLLQPPLPLRLLRLPPWLLLPSSFNESYIIIGKCRGHKYSEESHVKSQTRVQSFSHPPTNTHTQHTQHTHTTHSTPATCIQHIPNTHTQHITYMCTAYILHILYTYNTYPTHAHDT